MPTTFEMADAIRQSLRKGGKVLICGNGGSMSQADHFTAELVKDGHNCVSLSNPSTITAIANDEDFELIFGLQVLALGNPGDVLICLTTSNQSKNIRYATKCGQQRGMTVYTITGSEEPPDKNSIVVAIAEGCNTQFIQEKTLELLHILWKEL